LYERQQKSRPVREHGCGGSSSGVIQSGLASDDLRENCNTVLESLQEEVAGRFRPKHEKSVELAEVYSRLDLHSRAFRVADCGTFLEFHVTEEGKKLHKANFCKDRLCPMCNWRRSMKIFGQVSQVMDVLQNSGYRFLFLTLTVRNCKAQEFPATVRMLYDGWRNLYHETRVFKRTVCGTFRSLETTINQDTKEFHPHFHVILAVKPGYFSRDYVTQKQWADMWAQACALDYDPIVHIETVKEGPKGIGGAVAEAAKYAVKDSDFLVGPDWERERYVRTLLEGLAGRRLADMTGCFRKAKKQLGLDDAEDGDLVHVEGETLRDDLAYIVLRYQWRNGCYVVSDDEYCDYSKAVDYRQAVAKEKKRGPAARL
jgi:plasmid rolling circle replication initiator protein Rep